MNSNAHAVCTPQRSPDIPEIPQIGRGKSLPVAIRINGRKEKGAPRGSPFFRLAN
jgi:hypothetical protein